MYNYANNMTVRLKMLFIGIFDAAPDQRARGVSNWSRVCKRGAELGGDVGESLT